MTNEKLFIKESIIINDMQNRKIEVIPQKICEAYLNKIFFSAKIDPRIADYKKIESIFRNFLKLYLQEYYIFDTPEMQGISRKELIRLADLIENMSYFINALNKHTNSYFYLVMAEKISNLSMLDNFFLQKPKNEIYKIYKSFRPINPLSKDIRYVNMAPAVQEQTKKHPTDGSKNLLTQRQILRMLTFLYRRDENNKSVCANYLRECINNLPEARKDKIPKTNKFWIIRKQQSYYKLRENKGGRPKNIERIYLLPGLTKLYEEIYQEKAKGSLNSAFFIFCEDFYKWLPEVVINMKFTISENKLEYAIRDFLYPKFKTESKLKL